MDGKERTPWLFLLLVLSLWVVLSACVSGAGAPAADATLAETPAPAASLTPMSLLTQPAASPTSEAQAEVETVEVATPTVRPTLTLPDPQPGWAWYYTDHLGFAIPYPETWQTGPLRAPGSNSQIRVGAEPLPAGEDWLEWLRDNQREIFYTTPVSRDMVQANATVQGRPAFFRFAEGGGSSQMLLAFPDGDRVVYFYFHRGAGWEAEKRIFRTIVENLVWADGPAGETILPSGWEDGHVKTLFYDLAYPTEPLPPLHELEGTLAEWNTPVRNGVLLADDGQRYSVNAYHLGLVPNTENIEVGERVIITHYDMLDDPETIQPELIAVEWDGGWQLVLHKAYFDLTREALDAALIGRFPPDVRLQIRGSLAEVQPLLVDEEERSFPAGMWSLDPSSLVQAHGRAINPGDDLRLRLDYLYVSDNGGCLSHAGGGEECFYWHQVYPPVQPTTITATLRAVVPEANVLVLEEPVEGYITITPAAEGSPLAWEELTVGMQVMATGTAGPAGTLLAERVQVIMGVDEGE